MCCISTGRTPRTSAASLPRSFAETSAEGEVAVAHDPSSAVLCSACRSTPTSLSAVASRDRLAAFQRRTVTASPVLAVRAPLAAASRAPPPGASAPRVHLPAAPPARRRRWRRAPRVATPHSGSSPSAHPSFSVADVLWLRQLLDWLSQRRYNVLRANRGEDAGDFAQLRDSRMPRCWGWRWTSSSVWRVLGGGIGRGCTPCECSATSSSEHWSCNKG